MNLGDLLPGGQGGKFLLQPWKLFESNNGKPLLQSLARNTGEMLTNKATADWTNQHFLHDQPPVDPNLPNDTLNSPQNLALQKLLQGWLNPNG